MMIIFHTIFVVEKITKKKKKNTGKFEEYGNFPYI